MIWNLFPKQYHLKISHWIRILITITISKNITVNADLQLLKLTNFSFRLSSLKKTAYSQVTNMYSSFYKDPNLYQTYIHKIISTSIGLWGFLIRRGMSTVSALLHISHRMSVCLKRRSMFSIHFRPSHWHACRSTAWTGRAISNQADHYDLDWSTPLHTYVHNSAALKPLLVLAITYV